MLQALLLAAGAAAAYSLPNSNGAPPLAQKCGPSSSKIVCMHKYTSVMPYHFYREPSNGKDPGSGNFASTNMSDPSFAQVADADIIVYDEAAFKILGDKPSVKKMFEIEKKGHEAPVYVPSMEKIFFGEPAAPAPLHQFVIDLNKEPPTLKPYTFDPPIYAPNGATINKGKLYWAQSGGSKSLEGGRLEARPGIVAADPKTGKSETILNNFYGYYFNQINDLVVDSKGDIWFTDPQYAWFSNLSDTPPRLQPSTYRFRPSTGAVSIVDDTCRQPNGIAISADEKTMYIADSGSVNGDVSDLVQAMSGTTFNGTTVGRTIYAYDILKGKFLANKRPIYVAQDWIPDGVKVATNGYLVTGAGLGVDVIDPEEGTVVMRIQTDYPVQNLAFAGKDRKQLWMVGVGGVTRVNWELEGVKLE
ncbi:Gluconolactonase [Dactylellina cionopaga]|nr:Gluconolactonase [Dactylellina cionopaga]